MKIVLQSSVRLNTESAGSPPMSPSGSPFDIVRFQYFRLGKLFALKYF